MSENEVFQALQQLRATIAEELAAATQGLTGRARQLAEGMRSTMTDFAESDPAMVDLAAGPANAAGPPMLSVDEFWEQGAAAQQLGPPRELPYGDWLSENSELSLSEYPNGLQVFEKYGLTTDERDSEVLAAAVGHAIGAPVPPVIPFGEGGVIMPRLSGRIVGPTRADPQALEAMSLIRDHPDARRLGMLDLLVGNWDRSLNWLVGDNNRIYGIDHAFAFSHPGSPVSNPFTAAFVTEVRGGADPYRWIPDNPLLSRSHLTRSMAEVRALRPLFESYDRTGWHDSVRIRLQAMLDHAAHPDHQRPRHTERAPAAPPIVPPQDTEFVSAPAARASIFATVDPVPER